MLYVYAISDWPIPPPSAGLEGAVLGVTGRDGVFAIWSEHDAPRLEADETALWEHERVVEALPDGAAVLPMRFGSGVPDREALLELLEQRREEFKFGLDRVRGAVELGVRAMMQAKPAELAVASAGAEERPGTAYMLGRLNDETRSAALVSRIHNSLEGLSRASAPRRTSLTGSVNTAYLVDREDIAPFQATVEKLDDTLEEATIVCTGPWPPYSFTPAEPKP